VKDILGWIGVVLSNTMPNTWFSQKQTTDHYWKKRLVPYLTRLSRQICATMTDTLIQELGGKVIPGLLPGAEDAEFLNWFQSSPAPERKGGLQSVLLIATPFIELNLVPQAGAADAHEEQYLHELLTITMRGGNQGWPQVGHSALSQASEWMGDLIPLTPGSIVMTPLLLAPLNRIVDSFLPVHFTSYVQLLCKRCNFSWNSAGFLHDSIDCGLHDVQRCLDNTEVAVYLILRANG
jgi:hypothetical protein